MRQIIHNIRPQPKHQMANTDIDVDQLFLKNLQAHYEETRPPFMQDWLDAIDRLAEDQARRSKEAE